MIPCIVSVTPLPPSRLLLVYGNGERRAFDIGPWLNTGRFSELRNEAIFKAVRISFDTVEWPNGIDIDPEELYAGSVVLDSDAAGGSSRYRQA